MCSDITLLYTKNILWICHDLSCVPFLLYQRWRFELGAWRSVLARCRLEGWSPIFTTLLHRQLSLVPMVLFMHPPAPSTSHTPKLCRPRSLFWVRGTLEQDTGHASLHVVPNYPRPSDLPQPSIKEIPPYHCQDMPAYPPPSIKRFGHRKWFDLDAAWLAYAPLDGDCNLNSTLRNSSKIPLLSILKF